MYVLSSAGIKMSEKHLSSTGHCVSAVFYHSHVLCLSQDCIGKFLQLLAIHLTLPFQFPVDMTRCQKTDPNE